MGRTRKLLLWCLPAMAWSELLYSIAVAHTRSARFRWSTAAIHHVMVNRADGTTLPWPGLSSDLCSRLVLMHQRSEDRYGGLSTSPLTRDWLHLERQRMMGVWRHALAANMWQTGLGPLRGVCWVLLLTCVHVASPALYPRFPQSCLFHRAHSTS